MIEAPRTHLLVKASHSIVTMREGVNDCATRIGDYREGDRERKCDGGGFKLDDVDLLDYTLMALNYLEATYQCKHDRKQ